MRHGFALRQSGCCVRLPHLLSRPLAKVLGDRASGLTAIAQTRQPESTDKDVMKGKDRPGDGSANWQFAPLDQRSLCQAEALSTVASASINVRSRKRRKLPVCATLRMINALGNRLISIPRTA